MFTLLSGAYVHEGVSGNEQLILSATSPARSLALAAPGLPAELVAIVDRALAFEREQRWPDAQTMQNAVRAAIEALGGAEANVASGRPGGVLNPAGPTMLDTQGATSTVRAWGQERDVRQAEAAKLRTSVTDLTQRYGASRKHVVEAQAKIEAARSERASLEDWFAEHDATREQLAKLDAASAYAARDVRVHERALESHDPRTMRLGVLLMGVAVALLVALVVVPIVWRATRVVDAPPTQHLDPGPSPSR